jgi:hypothetical protein
VIRGGIAFFMRGGSWTQHNTHTSLRARISG